MSAAPGRGSTWCFRNSRFQTELPGSYDYHTLTSGFPNNYYSPIVYRYTLLLPNALKTWALGNDYRGILKVAILILRSTVLQHLLVPRTPRERTHVSPSGRKTSGSPWKPRPSSLIFRDVWLCSRIPPAGQGWGERQAVQLRNPPDVSTFQPLRNRGATHFGRRHLHCIVLHLGVLTALTLSAALIKESKWRRQRSCKNNLWVKWLLPFFSFFYCSSLETTAI